MDISLEGKVALVTGASRGIGRAIARTYAAAGASVMLSSRKQDALEAVVDEIAAGSTNGSGEAAAFAANAGNPEQIAACVEATVERWGRVDILVNNAATNPYMGPAVDIDLPRFDKTWEVNYRGPVVWVQRVWQESMQANGGVIVNISSTGGIAVAPGIGHYDVTKAALIHLTRTLAHELAPGVRVNAIAPGLVKTDFARALWEPNEKGVASIMPLKRIGEPQDIANAALFLASDLASWITGHTLVVDGGSLLRGTVA
ncbi:MAG TPA: SDR family oxidoreductase [Acidimicrobiales bacterium]|jgi:NAD(P)-dependent dehydrogenase (short-subunit alcohol dehydrogenase family)